MPCPEGSTEVEFRDSCQLYFSKDAELQGGLICKQGDIKGSQQFSTDLFDTKASEGDVCSEGGIARRPEICLSTPKT